jgi:glycerol-3-phosphate dehydrogenase
MTLRRDPAGASAQPYDLVVVGGGIQGATLVLEAALRGLRAVLVERGDFGGATSWNHLRILHGGLRYLQHGDLRRHRESVVERRWFLRHLPELVAPLPCLIPASWRSLRNPLGLAAAARLDDRLSRDRDEGVPPGLHLPAARVLRGDQLSQLRPGARGSGLLWYDAFMPRPRRVLVELLHLACALDAVVLNHAEAVGLLQTGGRVEGVAIRDLVAGAELELRAPLVVNAAGPDARSLAAGWDADRAGLGARTVAWNTLLDVELPAGSALAVQAPRRGAPTLFLVPWEGRTLAGTGHAEATPGAATPHVADGELAAFLDDLAAAAPELGIQPDRLLRVYAGFLPGTREGSAELSRRATVLDHGALGGPRGLWSAVGIKFTTARRVAEETLRRSAPEHAPRRLLPDDPETRRRRVERAGFGPDAPLEEGARGLETLAAMIDDEAVVHLDDLILRRTCLGDDPRLPAESIERIAGLGPWRGEAAQREIARVSRALAEARRSAG